MSEFCTVYCEIKDPGEVARRLRLQFPSSLPKPPSDQWETLAVRGNRGSLKVSQKVFRRQADEFSRLRWQTVVFVEGRKHEAAETRNDVAAHMRRCELILGIVADPKFDADDKYGEIVFAIAKTLKGVIFNGREFLDADGQTLMTTE